VKTENLLKNCYNPVVSAHEIRLYITLTKNFTQAKQ